MERNDEPGRLLRLKYTHATVAWGSLGRDSAETRPVLRPSTIRGHGLPAAEKPEPEAEGRGGVL